MNIEALDISQALLLSPGFEVGPKILSYKLHAISESVSYQNEELSSIIYLSTQVCIRRQLLKILCIACNFNDLSMQREDARYSTWSMPSHELSLRDYSEIA